MFAAYRILLKKSGSQLPRVELEEMGPSLDLIVRRTQLASEDLMKQACKKPKAVKVASMNSVWTNADEVTDQVTLILAA